MFKLGSEQQQKEAKEHKNVSKREKASYVCTFKKEEKELNILYYFCCCCSSSRSNERRETKKIFVHIYMMLVCMHACKNKNEKKES